MPAFRSLACAWFLLLFLVLPGVRAEDPTQGRGAPPAEPAPLTQREIAFHFLNRLAFGPAPGQVDELLERGWMDWVMEQFEPEKIDDSGLEERLAKDFPSLAMTCPELLEKYQLKRPAGDLTPEEEQAFQQKANQAREHAGRELREATLLRAVMSQRQLQEVLAGFWRNHFNIDQRKDQCQLLSANFEREVIRKHVFGKFEDMLMASAKHPAMLIYLDNVLSQKPLTEREKAIVERAGGKKKKSDYIQKLERQNGLNENYARELMELHTVGVVSENVPGGYSQKDVTEVARALTGWTVTFEDGKAEFRFRDEWHDDQPKTIGILGIRQPGKGGIQEGEDIIRRLARHPRTAQFLAWKLCRVLVCDQPSQELVDRIARKYLDTDGDLKEVTRAIIFDPAFATRQTYRSKFKTPFEFTVSALRTTAATIKDPQPTLNMLANMGQSVWQCVDPTGYYDHAEAWLDPGVLAYRWQFALRLAAGQMGGITFAKDRFAAFADTPPEEIEQELGRAILPGGVDAATTARCQTVRESEEDLKKLVHALMGLLLGSPTFQEQ